GGVGEENIGKSLRKRLNKRLGASEQITLAEDRNEAHALIEVSVVKDAEPRVTAVTVQVINARGRVIWPKGNSSRKYRGSADDVSAQIVKDLFAAIHGARH